MKIIKPIFFLSAQIVFVLQLSNQALANTLDPISAEEVSRAMLFTPTPTANLQARSASEPDGSEIKESAKLEFLGVKAHRFEKSEQSNGHRWADTLVYDYATDELITTVINLETNTVISVERNREMQPPLSENELERAINLVFEDAEEFSVLAEEFNKITGKTLTSKKQLNYKAFTFFADSMPNIVNEASKECGAQRCAQILLYTPDRTSLQYSPILNLSAGLVTQRIGQ